MSTEPGRLDYVLQYSDVEQQRYRGMAARARATEAALWADAGVVEGARVADIGCGPGAVLVELARIVGENGTAVGVEPNPEVRAAATREIGAAGVPWATVTAGTGTDSGLAPSSFDAVMIRHVLFHVGPEAQAVVRHCASLLRPGGHLYLVDTDMEASRLDPEAAHPDVVELAARYMAFQRGRGCNVGIGPRLGSLLLAAGLTLVQRTAAYNVASGAPVANGGAIGASIPTMIEAGAATPEDERRWRAALQNLAADPTAALFLTVFVAVGRRG